VSVTADAMTAWQGDYRSFVETVKRLVHTDWSEVRAGDEVNRLVEADAPIPAFDEMGLDGLCEDVLLSVFDAERHEAWLAEVTRDRTGRPTLGKWRLEGPDAMSGHWIDPIREAMR
jgi:hypothetical protein